MTTFRAIFSPRLVLLTRAIVGLAITILAALFLHVSGPLQRCPWWSLAA